MMLQRAPGADRRDRRRHAASERTARWRSRAEAGKVVVGVEVGADVVDWLIRVQWLAERDAADRGAIGEAITAMLQDATR
jgi:hypothetical protein